MTSRFLSSAGSLILGTLSLGMLLLTHTGLAQAPPPRKEAPALSAGQAVPAVTDGRTVKVESSTRLAPDAVAKIQAAFNRRLPRDLRTYTLGEIISAGEAAGNEGAPAGAATARIKVTIRVTCCPLTITIIFS
jgi:hypothetical protein